MMGPKKSAGQIKEDPKIIPLSECLAKTIEGPQGSIEPGTGVLHHSLLAGLVARHLIRRLPNWLVEGLFPSGTELLVALHDIGKVSPGFQEKIHRAIRTPEHPNGHALGLCKTDLDQAVGYHQAVSQAVMAGRGKYYKEIVGRHHGNTPIQAGEAHDEIYGGRAWQELREELIQQVKTNLNVGWPTILNEVQADALTGLTCVSDWIASGSVFDFVKIIHPHLAERIDEALDRAGFVAPKTERALEFHEVFSFQPRSAQAKLVETVRSPGVYVLEAPMGIGKTEAALYAAYQMLECGKATGIYFALPTQLTSDKIHDRVNLFLEKILAGDCIHRKSLLLHGSAWLRQTEVGGEGQPGKSWFDSRKRGLLAPFAVGTIDQALMAAMNVKHGFVRTFGLAGKVVILDEVHSYDSYTGTILDRLVEVLRELECTVIILSATLTAKRRAELLGIDAMSVSADYPLISARPQAGEPVECPVEHGTEMPVGFTMNCAEENAIEEALERAGRGEQVLWIENTVEDAQRLYRHLAARAGDTAECGLLHSRFLKIDRWRKEDHWVGIYGKGGGAQRELRGRILIGTQVLEQSLDIDADFLVSRICPMDMLLQRTGRLWRHRENDGRRPAAAKPQAWVLAPGLVSGLESEEAFGKTAHVYSPYVLCRTMEVLESCGEISVPGSIRSLLEAVYEERQEQGAWAGYWHKLEQEREKLRRLALGGVSRGGVTLPESKALTRHSDVESAEVLLIQSMERYAAGSTVRLLDGTPVDLPSTPGVRKTKAWREAAAILQQNTVRVPAYLAPECPASQLDWLKEYVWVGDDGDNPFRVAQVLSSGKLIGLGGQDQSKYELRYNDDLGYIAQRG